MGTHPIFESDFDCLTEWPFHEFSSICPSVVLPPVKLSWNFAPMSFPEPPRTSELSAPARRVSATRDHPSTESFPSSCARAVTSPTTTVLVANRSTETNSRTRTSSSSTLDLVSSPWPTLVQTPTVLSSSCAPSRPRGSTTSTLFSSPSAAKTAPPARRLSSPTVESVKVFPTWGYNALKIHEIGRILRITKIEKLFPLHSAFCQLNYFRPICCSHRSSR